MLEASNVCVSFGQRVVLDSVSLAVAPGEVVSVVGPNGAGKSTLLSIFAGERPADEGFVRIDGADTAALAPSQQAKQRTVLEQTPARDLFFTVDQLVGLGVAVEIPPEEADHLKRDAIRKAGLSGLETQRVSVLSGGEAHRAHFARALAQLWAGQRQGGGRYFLVDEPTASLDLLHQVSVLTTLRDVAAEDAAVILVLHDLTLAAAVSDRIAIMSNGRIVAIGRPEDVLEPNLMQEVYGLPIGILKSEEMLVVVPTLGAMKTRYGGTPCL